jgi:nitroimidazol reductase NimA-like FMN-containing flavoprotein (pyridoxamine 5'-phosphate oxidase superfamily)
MIRKMRRFKQALTAEVCETILLNAKRGVLAVLGDDDYPYTIPLNYVYDPKAQVIYFHGAREGHKIDAIAKHPKVSFCVVDQGAPDEGGWFQYVNSVVAFGTIAPVTDKAESIDITREIAEKYYPDRESAAREVEKDGARALCLALKIEHMTGKRVHEK